MEYRIDSILLVKLDHIGDMILATPAIEAVKRRYPHAFIGVLCGSQGRKVLINNPNVDRVWILDADMFDRNGGNNEKTKQRDWQSIRDIRRMRFDVCVGLRADGNNVPIMGLLNAKKIVSFSTDTEVPFLLDAGVAHTAERHAAKTFFDVLRIIDIPEPKVIQPRLYVTEEDSLWAEHLLKWNGVTGRDILIGISPGGGWHLNWWPVDRYISLCEKLQNYDGRIHFVIFGGKAESSLADKILLEGNFSAISAISANTVQHTAALMEKMRCIVCNDGGPMHMATAVQTPVVALFGPSPKWFHPLGERNCVIRKPFSCSPCPQFVAGEKAKCADNRCMQAITVEEVYQAVVAILEKEI